MPAPSHATDAKQDQKNSTRSVEATHQNGEPVPAFSARHSLLSLHRSIGNRAFGQVLQAKLAISTPGDVYEQEADRVADQVMATPVSDQSTLCEAHPQIQRFSGQSGGPLSAVPASVNQVLANSGRPLDSSLRQDMEQRFGRDFSDVKIHADSHAALSAKDVLSRAYTMGNDIVFGDGQFMPSTCEGRRLIAHELTHVVQQGGSAPMNGNAILPTISCRHATMVMRAPMTREDILRRMEELNAVINDLSFSVSARQAARGELGQLSILLEKGGSPKGPSTVNAVAPSTASSKSEKPKAEANLVLSPNAGIQEIVDAMGAIDAIKPSETASGLFQTTYKGRAITLTTQQVDQVRASAVKALSSAVEKVERRRDSAVGRYSSQEKVNEEFPVSSGAAKAWSWIRTFGEYSNPRESVHGESKKVTDESALARQAISNNSFAKAVRHLSAADAASERTSKIVHAYIDQLITGAESLETGLTYTRDAAFITVGVLAVVATGGAALGLEAGVVGTGVGGLTVAQTATVVSVGAPIVANLGVAGLKVAAGDKVDWGQLAVETAVQIILAKFGGRLSAGIAGKLAGNPATQTLGRQAIATLLSGAATHAVSQAFSVTVSSVFNSLRGQNVTWDTFLNHLINALTDPTGWFMVAVSSGVHLGAQVKVTNALKTQAGGIGTLPNEPAETGKKAITSSPGHTSKDVQPTASQLPQPRLAGATATKEGVTIHPPTKQPTVQTIRRPTGSSPKSTGAQGVPPKTAPSQKSTTSKRSTSEEIQESLQEDIAEQEASIGKTGTQGEVDDHPTVPEDRPQGGLFNPTQKEIDEAALARERGNTFNTERSGAYPYNEIALESPSGKGKVFLDSYDPGRAIVSRKYPTGQVFTSEGAIRNIEELIIKYPIGARIANTPKTRQLGIVGQTLRGQPTLEVPVLLGEVPQEVLDFARRVGVIVRDVEGRVY